MSATIISMQFTPVEKLDYENFVKHECLKYSHLMNNNIMIENILDELLNNATRCKDFPESTLEYKIEIENNIKISVKNRVKKESFLTVKSKIDTINNCTDINILYAEIMRSENDDGGLGLIRIVREWKCKLNIEIDNNDYIVIIAEV